MSIPATDTFIRADNSTLGPNWTQTYGASSGTGVPAGIVGNQAANLSTGENIMTWNADSFNNDQSSTATLSTHTGASGTDQIGVAVRTDGNSGGNGIWMYAYTTNIYRTSSIINGVTQATISFPVYPVPAQGDVMKLAVVGTRYYYYVNGTIIGTLVNTNFTAGSPALFFVGLYNKGGIQDWRLAPWVGDNQGAVPAPNPTSGGSGAHGTTFNLTISGTDFQGIALRQAGRNPVITISGGGVTVNTPLVSVVNNQIVISVSVTSGATLGARNITITNIDGQVGTLVGGFTVTAPGNPNSLMLMGCGT